MHELQIAQIFANAFSMQNAKYSQPPQLVYGNILYSPLPSSNSRRSSSSDNPQWCWFLQSYSVLGEQFSLIWIDVQKSHDGKRRWVTRRTTMTWNLVCWCKIRGSATKSDSRNSRKMVCWEVLKLNLYKTFKKFKQFSIFVCKLSNPILVSGAVRVLPFEKYPPCSYNYASPWGGNVHPFCWRFVFL